MYATDGQTNGQTDGQTKATLIAPFPTGGGIKIREARDGHTQLKTILPR